MYDGQLELEYTCVCCHKNTYPRRLHGGYCSDCLIGGMTVEELAAEAFEHEAWQQGYCDRYLYDYARDVLDGRRTLKAAARACYADVGEMEDAVEDLRLERAEEDRYWREYLTSKNASHIHRALLRGAAHARKGRT